MRHSRFHNAIITRGVLLFLAGAFLAAPGKAGAAKAPATVSISAPMTGAAVQLGENAAFYDLPLVRGQLMHTFNTAVYAHGSQRPWDSYLVLRPFGKPDAERAGQFRPSSVTSWKVNALPYDYVYQPRFSPDGEYIAFQTSNLGGSGCRSDIHLYSPRTHRLQTIVTMAAEWPVLWSPDGRYLAYIGGDMPGHAGGIPEAPMELWVYDRQIRQSRFLMRHDALLRQIAWMPDNQLLYSTVPDSGEMLEGKLASLYRVNPRSEKPAVYLLEDAIYPTPSPDGRWIAAFSLWDKRDKAFADKPHGARKAPPVHGLLPGKKAPTQRRQRRLMVFPSAGGKPIRVSDTAVYDGSYLLWSPDGAHLYRLSKRYDSKEKATACIYDFTLATRQEREIATFEYATEGPDNSDAWPRIKTLCVSRDGRYLFYSHNQRPDGVYLKALDLQTHEILTVCRVNGDFDWLDESAPAVKTSSAR